jgi:hypothetical protein
MLWPFFLTLLIAIGSALYITEKLEKQPYIIADTKFITGMESVAVGSFVRYPGTGTSGRVDSVEFFDGEEFARIEETGLYYRTDTLILTDKYEKRAERGEKSGIEGLKYEKSLDSDGIKDAFDKVDGVGAG